jgi:hypothetical protein
VDIPAFLYGTFAEVKVRSRAFLRDAVAGRSEAPLLLDTANVPGLLVIDRIGRARAAERQFQLYAPLSLACEVPRDNSTLTALFDLLATSSWGCLALMGQDAQHVPRVDSARAAFLRTVLQSWPLYAAEGARYTVAAQHPQLLWTLPTQLKRELAHRGLSVNELIAPLADDGLLGLLRRHEDRFADVLVDQDV